MFRFTKAQVMHLLAAPIAMLAGWCATLVANNIPGTHLTAGWLGGVFTVVVAGVLGLALHYLHGWQWWEKNIAPIADVTDSDGAAENLRRFRGTNAA